MPYQHWRRSNDGRVNECPGRRQDRLGLKLVGHGMKQGLVEVPSGQALRNRTTVVGSSANSVRENPQKRQKELLSARASASFAFDRSCRTARSSTKNNAGGSSPRAEQEMVRRPRPPELGRSASPDRPAMTDGAACRQPRSAPVRPANVPSKPPNKCYLY